MLDCEWPEPEKEENVWKCKKCNEIVPPSNVTFEETHENCGGECI